MKRNRLFRYVIHEQVPAYEAAGWIVKRRLIGTHGLYSVLMEYRPR